KAPVIEAVRVPPSACRTSQSGTIVRSPIAAGSTIARSDLPISRWISCVRPDGRPFASSRGVRLAVERGSIEYSAVTQPFPVPRMNCGTASSMVAAHSTRVLPTVIRADPSAVFRKPVSMLTGRIWSGRRLSGLIGMSHYVDHKKNRDQHGEREHNDTSHAALGGGSLRLSSRCFQLRHNLMLRLFFAAT